MYVCVCVIHKVYIINFYTVLVILNGPALVDILYIIVQYSSRGYSLVVRVHLIDAIACCREGGRLVASSSLVVSDIVRMDLPSLGVLLS